MYITRKLHFNFKSIKQFKLKTVKIIIMHFCEFFNIDDNTLILFFIGKKNIEKLKRIEKEGI